MHCKVSTIIKLWFLERPGRLESFNTFVVSQTTRNLYVPSKGILIKGLTSKYHWKGCFLWPAPPSGVIWILRNSEIYPRKHLSCCGHQGCSKKRTCNLVLINLPSMSSSPDFHQHSRNKVDLAHRRTRYTGSRHHIELRELCQPRLSWVHFPTSSTV